MDVISYALSKKYVDDTVVGMGSLKGSNCYISSIVDNLDGTHDITFSWKDTSDVTHTSVLTVADGETPTMGVTTITNGHRVTFTTTNPSQSITFDVTNGTQGAQGISVTSANVDSNNMLTFTLSSGITISAGQIIAVVSVDNALSTTSSNPVENKVITTALNNKVDKISGKGLSTEDYTTTEKNKLSNIEDGAEVNVIESVTVNGTEVAVVDKTIALTLLTTAVNNLTNYYLKTETYTKEEVQNLIGSTVGVSISIVSELPTTGETNIIYFVPTETENVYSQYIYTSTDGWVLIGSTTVDLSNYYTKTQVDTLLTAKQDSLTFDSTPTSTSTNPVTSGGVYTALSQKQEQIQYSTMPTASADNLGQIYQYIGSTATYTQGRFYRCVYDSTNDEYSWEEVSFSATITIDSAIDSTSTNPVQNAVISTALDTKQDIIQYSTMPSAEGNLGSIVQFVGTTTSTYTNGYFYKSVYDSTTDTYSWQAVNFPTTIIIDSVLDSTSTNPVQNAAITTELTDLDTRLDDVETVIDALGTASSKDYTSYVRPNNHALVESNAVYNAIANAISSIYTAHGNLTCAELTSDLLIEANVGNIYNMTDSGTTTSLFIQGAGVTISAGNTVGIIKADETNIYFNLMGNMIDLSDYQTQTLETPLTIDGTSVTTVEDALSALNTLTSGKQDALTFDSAPTDSSTNPVTSGGVYSAEQNIYEVMGKNGAKNLIPYPYINSTTTSRGITFTANDDGSITISGTATDSNPSYMDLQDGYYLSAGTYILSDGTDIDVYGGMSLFFYDDVALSTPYSGEYTGLLTQTSSNNVFIFTSSNGNGGHSTNLYGYDKTFTINSSAYLRVQARSINNSYTSEVSGTIYPMLRLANDTDSTYQPYSMTNQEITPYVQSISNPNLLDNPWFTVNQRGKSSYITTSNYQYTLDRWFCYYTDTQVVINSDGSVTVSEGSQSSRWEYFRQRLELDVSKRLLGKTVTLSFIDDNGIIWSGTGNVPSSIPSSNTTFINLVLTRNSVAVGHVVAAINYNGYVYVDIISTTGNSITIKAVKLELGSVSTLAMDTAPNYQQELAKCQRYFVRYEAIPCFNGYTYSSSIARLAIYQNMRTIPTVTYTVNGTYPSLLCNGTELSLTSSNTFSVKSSDNNTILLELDGFASLTANHACSLKLNSGTLDFSADL